MRFIKVPFLLACASADNFFSKSSSGIWSQEPNTFLAGSNFIPSNAQNELTMWQEDTFDPGLIDIELGWAENVLGFKTVRVFLHNLAWEEDNNGFIDRVKQYLSIARSHNIQTMFVLLDSCWQPDPKTGAQPEPVPFVHNSVWMQSPGGVVVRDPDLFQSKVQPYITSTISELTGEEGILAWDIWNEPNNNGDVDYTPLLEQVFKWARDANPTEPLTTPIWNGEDWDDWDNLTDLQRLQLDKSDIISFHNYQNITGLTGKVEALKTYGKPLICTEYMARRTGSTFDPILGYLAQENVIAINWGMVTGKTQTCYPWDSWAKPNPYENITIEELDWFHDILYPNGTAKYPSEIDYIRSVVDKF